MKNHPLKIAAAYIRVSTDDQTEYSPAAQLRELHEYAAQHNLLLDERYVYADEGISGRKADKRPGFMRMISDAQGKDHPFDVILVHKFDRFARSREDSIVYKSILKRAGVEVISIKEPLSEGSYSGVMEAIYESFAEAYSINLGQEVRKGMTEKALRGEPQTAAPFGYRLENKEFIPHEAEAPLIRQIFERFATGDGLFAVAKWLNAQGITTHRGSPFENRTVEYILRNPVYIGMLRWNPKRRSRRNYNDPDILTVPGKHQPLIDQPLWDAVQARIAEVKATHKYHGRPSYDRKHWLCGIVRCASCGTTLIFSKPHYLKCNHYVRGRCATSQHIAVNTLAEALLSKLRDDLLTDKTPTCRLIRTKNAAEQTLQALRQSLDRVERKRSRLTEAYLNEAISLSEYKKLQQALEEELSSAKEALTAAENSMPTIDTTAELRSAIEQTLYTLNSEASIDRKYDALNRIIETCTFDKSTSTLAITYRLSL